MDPEEGFLGVEGRDTGAVVDLEPRLKEALDLRDLLGSEIKPPLSPGCAVEHRPDPPAHQLPRLASENTEESASATSGASMLSAEMRAITNT
jgi:hypothetical protein